MLYGLQDMKSDNVSYQWPYNTVTVMPNVQYCVKVVGKKRLKIAGFDMKTKHKLTIRCVPSILAFYNAE